MENDTTIYSIKDLYNKNINIMQFFRENKEIEKNSIEAILCSYDLQAGTYVSNYYSDKILEEPYLIDGEKKFLTDKEFHQIYGRRIANVLNHLQFYSLLEVGIGEATTLCNVVKNLKEEKKIYGLDLSLSRLLYAKKFAKDNKVDIELSVGDMFHLPFADSSIDIIYTAHCIEPNTGKEKEAVKELYRVAKKYLVLIEPSYNLGNDLTKQRINEHKYIKGLYKSIQEMNLQVIYYDIFSATYYYNNGGIIIIKKNTEEKETDAIYKCPYCNEIIKKYKNNFFCQNCSSIYPIIEEIGILAERNSIFCSKYMDIDIG